MANFAVTLSLVFASGFAALYSERTGLNMLKVEAEVEPTLALSDGAKRPWLVNPMGYEKEFPVWAIFFAILPAVGFAVLGYLDQNLTSVIANRPSNNLQNLEPASLLENS